jgi:hypothetical protein
MADPVVNGFIGIAGTFGSELPYCPVLAMLAIEECYKLVEWVAVRTLRVRLRRARSKPGAIVSGSETAKERESE